MANFNYLTNSLERIERFAGDVTQALEMGLGKTPWGAFKSKLGTQRETGVGKAASAAARSAAPFITGEAQLDAFRLTSPFIQARKIGQTVGSSLGLEKTGSAIATVGVPAVIAGLSGISGSPLSGFRPAGQKAVVPVSKEEDPTGRTPLNPLVEGASRYFLGQRGQILPYQEFKKERPDVMPSTYYDYKRYQYSKPEAGKLVDINPERGTFTALGGSIKGSAQGLNDPEIRLRGVPITASALAGTAAGLGTIKGLSSVLNPQVARTVNPQTGEIQSFGSEIPLAKQRVGEASIDYQKAVKSGASKTLQDDLKKQLEKRQQALEGFENLRKENLTGAAKQFQNLGAFKDPALLAAGTVAALGTAAVARNLMAKAKEEKVKKEDPVEYLQYKHGGFGQAKEALGQPEARSWQQLTPYV